MRGFERWPGARAWAEARPAWALAALFAGLVLVVPIVAWPFSFAERLPPWARRGQTLPRPRQPRLVPLENGS